ncbi:DUF5060 domain-containing protein [Hymenobacter sp. J193]|uniref:DUF5060 domain-containing protein n=1 Tax=Hymenobacter sp. J193 TaxID=2898429 RepID=UPI0021518D69|nr:DUF5060 domain-containing protein [Hymenobacter sp. J193]MCR5890904.1 DUF5060 domain-containing protein [Hymenobacter sp. J193]
MKNCGLLLLTLLALLSARPGYAQGVLQGARLLTAPVRQYEKAEWDITVAEQFRNAYDQREVTLDLVLTSPTGRPVVLPCYFERNEGTGSTWKARFAPQETGSYAGIFRLTRKAGTVELTVSPFSVGAGRKPGFLHPHNLYTFRFDDGTLFRGVGENVAWESRSFEDQKFTYDYLLPTLAQNGANFFRTWMCYWNLPLEWPNVSSTRRYANSPAYFHPGAIKRMDELVSLTDSLNLYFMLTLDWHGHLMEQGGWKNSPYNQLNGGPARTPTEFFTLPAAREKYKNKLRYVVARWGYSANIAAWEFFNEVDNAAFTQQDSVLIPHEAITLWHGEMSRYLKDIDPYQHLVTTSISHRDILGLNAVAYFDFHQKHIYKHTEKIPAIYPNYIQTYGKPYVVGEFGYRWEDADPAYKDGFNYDYRRGLWYGLFSATPILPMTWWWELFDDQQMTPYFRGVRAISDRMLAAGQGEFEPFTVAAGGLQSFGMRCGDQYFVYLLNASLAPITAAPTLPEPAGRGLTAQSFEPTSRQYQPVSGLRRQAGTLTLPTLTLAPRQERVLILTAKPSGKTQRHTARRHSAPVPPAAPGPSGATPSGSAAVR